MARLAKIFGFAFTVGFWLYVWSRYPDPLTGALAATAMTCAALILLYWAGVVLAWVFIGEEIE